MLAQEIIFHSVYCSNQSFESQNLGDTSLPFLVTLNPERPPDHTLLKWTTGHPVPSVAATKASLELHNIQGKRGIWFCGAYQGKAFFLVINSNTDITPQDLKRF